MVELNENFVIFLTLFVLSFSLPKFLLLFRAKLLFMLFMLLIAFQVLLSKIKLHMSAFLGHLQIITIFVPSDLLVLFFFSHISITNLSLSQGFVVFKDLLFSWLWRNLKGISVSSSSYFPQCCLLGTSPLCQALSLLCLPIYLLSLRSFSK